MHFLEKTLLTLIASATIGLGIYESAKSKAPISVNNYVATVLDANHDITLETSKIIQKEISDSFIKFDGGNIYVLMFNSDTVNVKYTEGGTRFRKNIDSMYVAFRNIDVDERNLFTYQGGDNNPSYVKGKATKRNIYDGLSQIAKISTLEDLVIIYGTNHGENKTRDNSRIQLDNYDYLEDYELNKMLDMITAKAVVVIAPPCKNFFTAYNVAEDNRIGMSASGPDKNSATGGFSKKLADAIMNAPDIDNDKKVSLMEVFDYATRTYPGAYLRDLYGSKKETPHLIYAKVDPKNIIIRKE